MDPYIAGQIDVYDRLGMSKEAFIPALAKAAPGIASVTRGLKQLPGVGRAARTYHEGIKPKATAVGKMFLENLIGHPRQFAREIASGTALGREGLIRSSLRPEGKLGKGLFYGIPAYMAQDIIRDEEGQKAQRLAGMMGGHMVGWGMWRPLGILGSIYAAPVGEQIGRGAAKTLETLSGRELG